MVKLKNITVFVIIVWTNILISQESKQIFELKETHNNSYFFNSIVMDGKLFFGTANGVQFFDTITKKIKLVNTDFIGSIDYYDGTFIQANTPIDNIYDYLLPFNYSKSNSIVYNSEIYVISRGVLFVFKLTPYNFKSFPSIRAISKKYLGSYGGIFNTINNKRLEFPTSTNSFIREFDDVTFINWHGLSIIDNQGQRNFYSPNGEGIKIKDKVLGSAIDVEQIDKNNFLLFTTYGMYLLDIETLDIKKIISDSKDGAMNFIRSDKDQNGVYKLYIHNEKSIYQYLPKSQEINVITTINSPIMDVYSISPSEYFVITKKDVRKIHLTKKTENYTLFNEIVLPNNIGVFKWFVFVTSDVGLHLFDLKTKTGKKFIIREEFNKNAFYIDKDILKLGSINGLYEFDNSKLTNLFDKQVNVQIEKSFIINKEEIFAYAFLIVLLGIGSFVLFNQRMKKKYRIKEKYEEVNQAQINEYIVSNISSVSINSICDHFELNVNKLYNLLGKKKPGDIIREERLKILRQMRIENKSIKDIAQATGFSTSYIKKLLSSFVSEK